MIRTGQDLQLNYHNNQKDYLAKHEVSIGKRDWGGTMETLSEAQRRVLSTEWLGEAWITTCNATKVDDPTVSRMADTFDRCGCSLTIDRSEDHLIRPQGFAPNFVPTFQAYEDAIEAYNISGMLDPTYDRLIKEMAAIGIGYVSPLPASEPDMRLVAYAMLAKFMPEKIPTELTPPVADKRKRKHVVRLLLSYL